MPYLFKKYYPFRNLVFCAGEGLLIFVTYCLTQYLLQGSAGYFSALQNNLIQSAVITVTLQFSLYFFDLYDLGRDLSLSETATRTTLAFGAGCIVLGIFFYSLPPLTPPVHFYWQGYFGICGVVLLWRGAYYFVLKRRMFVQNILVLGTGELAAAIAEVVEGKQDSAYTIIQFIGDSEVSCNPHNVPVTAQLNDMIGYCKDNRVEKIVLALDDRRKKTPTRELLECKLNGISIEQGVSFYEGITGRLMVEREDPSGIFFSHGFSLARWQYLSKRVFDILLSVIGLTLALPIMLLTAILIKLDSPGAVFYLQKRVGERGVAFKIIKFRSMYQNAEKDGAVWADENDSRITRVGDFIRKFRIDEIPQLWNVLKGEMSLVGPRPERPVFVRDLAKTIPYYAIRHYIKPGVTGWAQVCCPYAASEEDSALKLEYDLYYMRNISIVMDLLVMFRTIKIILLRKGSR
jgi:sugar transferase (PEP-CTERM system associated)